jgi:pimeloyl-ACP methyl ester carboxylesterase
MAETTPETRAFDAGATAEKQQAEAAWSKATLGARSRAAEHAVFLVPGLLGFENFSELAYFDDRLVAALRAGLEQSWEQPVPVVAVPIPPIASLRERQRKLVKTLADRLRALEHGHRPLQVHLVGHSTGGIDANLLTDEGPVGGGVWADLDPRAPELRARIRSVVSIASPHQGACITRDPVARVFEYRDLRGVPALAGLLGSFTLSALADMEADAIWFSLKREARKSFQFLVDVLGKWELLADLQPSFSSYLQNPNPKVLRRTFVTIAGCPMPGAAATPPADAFFRQLSERASGLRTGCRDEGALVSASVARLKAALASKSAEELVIKSSGTTLPKELDGGHNDGLVNTARQLIDPEDSKELAGIVVGDHFDVVGYYDRHVWKLDSQGNEQYTQVFSGLLHSGSGFRDDQFFELYGRVARVLAEAT